MFRRARVRNQQAWSMKSLVERLAALEDGTLTQTDLELQRLAAQRRAAKSRQRVLRTCFGIGVVSGGIVGGVALLYLLFANP
jgi:hypothetical protein